MGGIYQTLAGLLPPVFSQPSLNGATQVGISQSPPGPQMSQYAKPGPYQTSLGPEDETGFQAWVKNNKIPFDPSPTSDYDMRGYYQALMAGDPEAKRSLSGYDGTMHFPDTYKTPYHKTFSNQSRYATPDAPQWQGNRLLDKTGKVLADETPRGGSAVRAEPDWDANDYAAHGLTPPR